MVNQKDLLLLSFLRQNARETLTTLSKKTNIPISTIYDKLKFYEGDVIKKFIPVLNFEKLGYNARVNIILKIEKEQKDDMKEYLVRKDCINSIFKINNGYDFLLEGIFKDMKDVEIFMEALEEKFKVKSKQIYYIIDDIKTEGFMTPSYYVN